MYSVFRPTPPLANVSSEECSNSAERLLISSVSSRSINPEAQSTNKTFSGNNRDSGAFLNYMLNQHRSSGIFIFDSSPGSHLNSDIREITHAHNHHPHLLSETHARVAESVAMNSSHKQEQSSSNVSNVPQGMQSNNVPITPSTSTELPCSVSGKTNVSSTNTINVVSKCPQTLPVISDVQDTKNSSDGQSVNNECDFSKVIERPTNFFGQNTSNPNEVVCCMNCKRCLHSIFCFHHINVCSHKNSSLEMRKADIKIPNYSECFSSVCKHASLHDCSQLCCCKKPVIVKNAVSHCLNSVNKMSTVVTGENYISCKSIDYDEISNEMSKKLHCVNMSHSHICEVCFKSYSSSTALANHVRYHRGERPYQCETCNKAFATNSHLVTHRRIHTGERPFQCPACHRSFADRSAFIKHERTHGPNGSIIKRFKCEECGNAFVDSCGLKKHIRTHTGERPYKCAVCEKSFSTSSTFVAHKRIHSGERPYKCDQCTKMFITKSHLLTHRRVHTGEKPFTCQVCNRSFADGSSFRRHERLHTGDSRHVCELCGKGFQCETSLERHKQSHIAGASSFMYMM